ncbi:MAG: sulfatase-like hydrolase/transferase [Chthoniobacter sp.]|nr:sulfatase-like hydrolase/transferase [Chthoniobacter sp.]
MKLLLSTLVLLSVLCAGGLAAESGAKPNVLFLFSDDQRADTIGALGNTVIRTPALDALVGRGTAFTRAYCMGANQGAVCVPSRAMLMSGRTLFRVNEQLHGQTTWPEKFAAAGYTTFITGKWHNGGESALRSFQRGKAVFLGGMGDPYKLPLQDIGEARTFANKRVSGGHSVQVFTDAAVEFLREQKGTAPFLCYVAFNAPHDPRIAPKEYREKFYGHEPPAPANFLPVHPFNNGEMTIRDEALAPWPRTPEIVRQHLADYYAYIEFMDAQIGRIIEALQASGQAEKTIVVFASDHGLAIGSHGLFGKQNLYDHSMHAPLVLAGPGIPQGRRSDALCYLLDIFPTLGALAGVPAPEGSEGRSLIPVATGQAETSRAVILTAYTKVQRALREDRWKLIVYPQINKTQLFDLKADPLELHDLAADPQHAEEVRRLTARLHKEQAEAGDNLPLSTATPQPAEFTFPSGKRSGKVKSIE